MILKLVILGYKIRKWKKCTWPKKDRRIYKKSPLFERAKKKNINDDENDQFPLEINFGEQDENSTEGRYDYVKMNRIKKR